MRHALALSVFLCSPAFAQQVAEIPAHDVEGTCRSASSPQSVAFCTRNEQASYDEIKILWPQASPWVRGESVRYADQYKRTRSYYAALLEYAQSFMRDEQIAADRASPPRFSR